jgi:hypothetical protein
VLEFPRIIINTAQLGQRDRYRADAQHQEAQVHFCGESGGDAAPGPATAPFTQVQRAAEGKAGLSKPIQCSLSIFNLAYKFLSPVQGTVGRTVFIPPLRILVFFPFPPYTKILPLAHSFCL